jgi:hypothetical protein
LTISSLLNRYICRIEDSPRQAAGNLHRKDDNFLEALLPIEWAIFET